MNAEDYLEAICFSLVGLAVAGWLILRRLDRIDLGRVA